ncbi:MAG: hypothetical protein SA339_10360 [Methanomassiliicoccus sp.]|nr:hypothetical protein [Methanomassiliicoccus sp.]
MGKKLENDSLSADRVQARTERRWPLLLIISSIVLGIIIYPIYLLLPYVVTQTFDYYIYASLAVLLAPILYVCGVVEMVTERRAGAKGRYALSQIGGATLLVGGLFGAVTFIIYAYQLFTFDIPMSLSPYDALTYVLPVIGAFGSLLGAYFALKRTSFRGALLAGLFSIFLTGYVFPLALLPIALDIEHFNKSGEKSEK